MQNDDVIYRQAAIDALSYCQTYLFDSRDDDKKISLEDAGYALEQLPPAQPEKAQLSEEDATSDCIDRKAAIDAIRASVQKYTGFMEMEMYTDDDAVEAIEGLPSAERKRGRWTDNNACPFCGFQPWYERDIHTLSYCPNCGADMRGEEDETD